MTVQQGDNKQTHRERKPEVVFLGLRPAPRPPAVVTLSHVAFPEHPTLTL